MHVLSLCSGGGLDLGIRLAVPAARCICHVEGEVYAASLLVRRMGAHALDQAIVSSDVRFFDDCPWRVVDCVAGRYPCRPFKTAGIRLGHADPATPGPPSAESSTKSGPASVSSRTFPAIYRRDSRPSPTTCKRWATELRRACSRRRKSAPHTDGNGSSSWPTPAASNLNEGEHPSTWSTRQPRIKRATRTGRGMPLGIAVQSWAMAAFQFYCCSDGSHAYATIGPPGCFLGHAGVSKQDQRTVQDHRASFHRVEHRLAGVVAGGSPGSRRA